MDEAPELFAKALGATITSRKKISVGAVTGEEFRVELNVGGHRAVMQVQSLVGDKGLYMLQAAGVAGQYSEDDAQRFFKSFRLTDDGA